MLSDHGPPPAASPGPGNSRRSRLMAGLGQPGHQRVGDGDVGGIALRVGHDPARRLASLGLDAADREARRGLLPGLLAPRA